MKTEKPEECEACRFETDDLTFYDHGPGYPEGAGHWICKVCACTMSGNAHRSPGCYKEYEVLHMLSYCTNLILDALKKKEAPQGIKE
ncbi:MAG TPA: hypothetical protein VJ327_11025 [Patescibacteria group bacterium]|nr:hypothetical protein [Patescibacteria group bacterium]